MGCVYMNSVLVVMAILGCADGGSQCQTVRMMPATYSSVDACKAAMPAALENATDLPYPSISANCEKKPAQTLAMNLPARK